MRDKPYIFLLGGYDLEMIAIKTLLITLAEESDSTFTIEDKNLAWGAKLSEYTAIIENADVYQKIYGIELINDLQITLPPNYVDIDHHNEKSELPSSIEQIAELFNVKLNRKQQLVALNDKGYIPAMLEFGATDEEINAIRKADRKAQGVTIEQEQQAEIDVGNAKEESGVLIINTAISKFSPIADLTYKADKKIIYNTEVLNFYGIGKHLLVEKYAKLIEENKAYHGGGKNGYFGLLDAKPEHIREIIKIVGNEN